MTLFWLSLWFLLGMGWFPCCCMNEVDCADCSNSMPTEIEVTISGIVSASAGGGCGAACDDLNANYILPFSDIFGACGYLYEFSPICGPCDLFGTDGYGALSVTFNESGGSTFVEGIMGVPIDNTNAVPIMIWSDTITGNCCQASGSIPFASQNSGCNTGVDACDGSSASFTITLGSPC